MTSNGYWFTTFRSKVFITVAFIWIITFRNDIVSTRWRRISFIIILPRGKSNTFTDILCSWWLYSFSFLKEDLLFHFRLYLLHPLVMNQNPSALLDFDDITLHFDNNLSFSVDPPHSSVNICGCDVNTPHTSSKRLTTSVDSLITFPNSFESLPTFQCTYSKRHAGRNSS